MANKPNSHYSPKLANKPWADDGGYLSYLIHQYSGKVVSEPKGWKQWGRKKGLYSWSVEHALDRELETQTKPIYQKLSKFNEPTKEERSIWAQFILSQLVRTPTFIKYEQKVKELTGDSQTPTHERVGCQNCDDLRFVANRNWCLLLAHEDDFFVRSDNPVLQTGFIELPTTCLYYPLTPKICFVACSMPNEWDATTNVSPDTKVRILSKGASHQINFYLAKCTGESLIISPTHNGIVAERMFGDMLSKYPQPPFPLHFTVGSDIHTAYESIRKIMSLADLTCYPRWNISELEPFYG